MYLNILILMKLAHVEESSVHLFCDCTITNTFMVILSSYIFNPTNVTHSVIFKYLKTKPFQIN